MKKSSAKDGKRGTSSQPRNRGKKPVPARGKPERLSALDAAARVLASAHKPMRAGDIITEMEAKGLWKTPGGKTPGATLYSSMIREIAARGPKSRFKKTDRGLFVG